MNTTPQPSIDPGSLADKIYNELCKYMDVVDMAEFVANNPSLDAWIEKLDTFRKEATHKKNNVYKPIWVTDFLVQTPKGTYKEYKRAS